MMDTTTTVETVQKYDFNLDEFYGSTSNFQYTGAFSASFTKPAEQAFYDKTYQNVSYPEAITCSGRSIAPCTSSAQDFTSQVTDFCDLDVYCSSGWTPPEPCADAGSHQRRQSFSSLSSCDSFPAVAAVHPSTSQPDYGYSSSSSSSSLTSSSGSTASRNRTASHKRQPKKERQLQLESEEHDLRVKNAKLRKAQMKLQQHCELLEQRVNFWIASQTAQLPVINEGHPAS